MYTGSCVSVRGHSIRFGIMEHLYSVRLGIEPTIVLKMLSAFSTLCIRTLGQTKFGDSRLHGLNDNRGGVAQCPVKIQYDVLYPAHLRVLSNLPTFPSTSVVNVELPSGDLFHIDFNISIIKCFQ